MLTRFVKEIVTALVAGFTAGFRLYRWAEIKHLETISPRSML